MTGQIAANAVTAAPGHQPGSNTPSTQPLTPLCASTQAQSDLTAGRGPSVSPATYAGADDSTKGRQMDSDPVNSPAHYTQGEIECIVAIRAALTREEFRGYCKGNAIKYIWRERIKGNDESLAKAVWYMNEVIDE